MLANLHDIRIVDVVFALYWLYMLAVSGIGVAGYVLQSMGFFSIAKRRGIKKPWLSWIPLGGLWIMGCISDQYQYVVKGRVKNKRKALLILSILLVAVCVIFYAIFGVLLAQMLYYDDSMLATDHAAMLNMMVTGIAMAAVSVILLGLSIAITAIQYIALYDLYASCEPGKKVLFLMLSIFVGVCAPVFIFLCRNKDLGMPPRKPEVLIEE